VLGDVIRSLSLPKALDPIYGIELKRGELIDHIPEEPLSTEEERMNREMKVYHPVYNNMPFPEPLSVTARTVTATCTRVSRESLVISSPEKKGQFRRLTLRERASLQGFPITFQFFGDSYSQKMKMIGNAIPPLFTYYIANAILNTKPEKLQQPHKVIKRFMAPTLSPKKTSPDGVGRTYPSNRTFRAAVPGLRFKSGVRFEFANDTSGNEGWSVRFFFGNSKEILRLNLGEKMQALVMDQELSRHTKSAIQKINKNLTVELSKTTAVELQKVWSHNSKSGVHPYEVVDAIGSAAKELTEEFKVKSGEALWIVKAVVDNEGTPTGSEKLLKHASAVAAGLIVGSIANLLMRQKKWS
jgi:DNA (cytosine-5)-methyltransferase 1